MDNFWNDVLIQVNEYYELLISLMPKLALAIIVIVIALLFAGWIRRFSLKRLTQRMDDPLLANFLSRLIKITVIILGFLLVLRIIGLGDAAASVLAGAGISAFIIGFAFKDIGENFLAGILMAFQRPFRIGDVVKTGDIEGTIIGLTLRDTQIKTFDGKDVYVPNGILLKNPLINSTIDGFLRLNFELGVDYESNLDDAIKTIYASMKQVKGLLWSEEKAPKVVIKDLGVSTVNLMIYFWIDTFNKEVSGLTVKTNAIREVVESMAAAGFYMPADIIELKNYNKESLSTAQAK